MNIFSITGLFIVSVGVVLGTFTFLRGKKLIHFIWGFFSFSIALWGLGSYMVSEATEADVAIFWWKAAYVGVILIPALMTNFVQSYTKNYQKTVLSLTYLVSAIFLFFNVSTSKFINSVQLVFDQFYYINNPTGLYNIFVAFFSTAVLYNLYILISAYVKEDAHKKKQIGLFVLAILIGFSGGGAAFLPVYDIYVYPVFNITVSISIFIVAYAMLKYHFMNIKIALIEAYSLLMFFLFFINIFFYGSTIHLVLNLVTFFGVSLSGILLVRSARKEIRQKEEFETLTRKLARSNAKLKELDRAKNEFISITAHQLRTPPTVIKGYINLAQEDPNNKLDEETKESLERALVSNERLIDLIEDILNVSRIESGKMKYEMKDNSICEDIMQEVYDAFALKAESKGIDLILNKPPKPLPKIKVDRKKIREVISNLVDNAIKYTKKGSVEMRAREKGGNIRIEVKDTGVGITKEDMPELFKKFYRGKDPSRLGAEGTGLGIFVGNKIVKDHGGKIWAKSDGPNRGSTFIIELPIHKERDLESIVAEEDKKMKEELQKKKVESFVKDI